MLFMEDILSGYILSYNIHVHDLHTCKLPVYYIHTLCNTLCYKYLYPTLYHFGNVAITMGLLKYHVDMNALVTVSIQHVHFIILIDLKAKINFH